MYIEETRNSRGKLKDVVCCWLLKDGGTKTKVHRALFTTFRVKKYFPLNCRISTPLLANVIINFNVWEIQTNPLPKTKRHLATRVKGHRQGPSAIQGHIDQCSLSRNKYSCDFYQFLTLVCMILITHKRSLAYKITLTLDQQATLCSGVWFTAPNMPKVVCMEMTRTADYVLILDTSDTNKL